MFIALYGPQNTSYDLFLYWIDLFRNKNIKIHSIIYKYCGGWRIQGGGGGQGGEDPPWDSLEKVSAHGKITVIC